MSILAMSDMTRGLRSHAWLSHLGRLTSIDVLPISHTRASTGLRRTRAVRELTASLSYNYHRESARAWNHCRG